MALTPAKTPGKPAPRSELVNVPRLVSAFFTTQPDVDEPTQRVAFGTSGHRGSALHGAFNEAHILAITQAIVTYRRQHGIDGPLFLGVDTHALSEPAFQTALEVLAANEVETLIEASGGGAPAPAGAGAGRARGGGRRARRAGGGGGAPARGPPEGGGGGGNPPN